MSTYGRILVAVLGCLVLVRCSSSSSQDGGGPGTDASTADSAPPRDAMPGSDAVEHIDALPQPDATTFPDAMPPETGPIDAQPRDAGCVAPLANCNGSGLTCEVNTSTNSLNCGACMHSCFGARCSSSLCEGAQVGRGDGLQAIMSQGILYTTDTNSIPSVLWSVRRVRNEGTIVEEIANGVGGPGGIDADDTYVYFAVQGNPGPTLTVYRKAHTASAGSAPEVVFTPVTFPTWLVVRAGFFYWLSPEPTVGVFRRALSGPVSDHGTAVSPTNESRIVSLTATSTVLYWQKLVANTYVLRQLAVTATAASDVPGAVFTPPGVAGARLHADRTRVYWGARGAAAPGVYSYYAGGRVVRLTDHIAAGLVLPDLFSDQVFFGDGYVGTMVYKVSKSGGTPVAIATRMYGADIPGSDARFFYATGQWGSVSPVFRYVK